MKKIAATAIAITTTIAIAASGLSLAAHAERRALPGPDRALDLQQTPPCTQDCRVELLTRAEPRTSVDAGWGQSTHSA